MISFFLTTKCNLNCGYCYTNKTAHKEQTLSLEFAKAGIEDYFSYNRSRHIRFFAAGEPTEAMELMKQIRQHAFAVGGSGVLVESQTNGAFSISRARWLAENVNIIWVSSDGTPVMQDLYRRTLKGKPTSKVVERNIRFLVKNCCGTVGVRTTITAANVGLQTQILEYFGGLGVRAVWSDPLFPSVGQTEVTGGPDPMEYAHEFVVAERYARQNGIFYGSILTCNFDEDIVGHCRACLPAPHLTTDGYVSACDMALFGRDGGPMAVFIYGRWNAERGRIEYDQQKIDALRSRTVEHLAGCRGCEARFRCGGYCLGEVLNETGSLYGKKARTCEAIRYLWHNLPRPASLYPCLHP
jgi:radical SAM protein with 4Fe4S-binding SPASM domain